MLRVLGQGVLYKDKKDKERATFQNILINRTKAKLITLFLYIRYEVSAE